MIFLISQQKHQGDGSNEGHNMRATKNVFLFYYFFLKTKENYP